MKKITIALIFFSTLYTCASTASTISTLKNSWAEAQTPATQADIQLISAVKKGNAQQVMRLLKKGANPAATDALGKSALDYAQESMNNAVLKANTKSQDNFEKILQKLENFDDNKMDAE